LVNAKTSAEHALTSINWYQSRVSLWQRW
jgi:hypothetical protein